MCWGNKWVWSCGCTGGTGLEQGKGRAVSGLGEPGGCCTVTLRASKHSYKKVTRFSRIKRLLLRHPSGAVLLRQESVLLRGAQGKPCSSTAAGSPLHQPFASPQQTPGSRRPLLQLRFSRGRCVLLPGLVFASASVPSPAACGHGAGTVLPAEDLPAGRGPAGTYAP